MMFLSKNLVKTLLVITLIAWNFSLGLSTLAQEKSGVPKFLVKPYIQLGNNSKIQKKGSLVVAWCSFEAYQNWKLFYRQKGAKDWIESKQVDYIPIGRIDKKLFFQHRAEVENIDPGAKFEYKIVFLNQDVFSSEATMRKSKDQPYSFAVSGDVGAGSIGQKKVAYQCYKKKPDMYLLPGDVVYNRGLVSEYLSRFFPIMNSDKAEPNKGAPLLRTTLSIAAIGNHDIALSNRWRGVNFTRYPDALGYYLFFDQPLNGPNKMVNAKNTTRIIGDPKTQVEFVRATKGKFPQMGNFSFDYGNSHWLVVDANPYMDWTDKKMRAWVEKDLVKAQNAKWRFVLCHQPGFTIDNNHWIEQRMRLLCDLFEKHKVSIVFSGHAHAYQRTYPIKFAVKEEDGKPKVNIDGTVNGAFTLDKKFDGKTNTTPSGVIYIVTGAGGASLYKKGILNNSQSLFNMKFINHKHSFTLCNVEGSTLTLKQISCDGEELDKIVITQNCTSSKGKIE